MGTGKEAERDLPTGRGGEKEQERPGLRINTMANCEHHLRCLGHQAL